MGDNVKGVQVKKQGQITKWMEQLELSLRRADEICQHFNDSLKPLLRNEPSTEGEEKAEVAE